MDKIAVWPDGFWCNINEVEDYTYRDSNYIVVPAGYIDEDGEFDYESYVRVTGYEDLDRLERSTLYWIAVTLSALAVLAGMFYAGV